MVLDVKNRMRTSPVFRHFPILTALWLKAARLKGGDLCASEVGAVHQGQIIKYIENQKWDQDDEGFKITAPAEP